MRPDDVLHRWVIGQQRGLDHALAIEPFEKLERDGDVGDDGDRRLDAGSFSELPGVAVGGRRGGELGGEELARRDVRRHRDGGEGRSEVVAAGELLGAGVTRGTSEGGVEELIAERAPWYLTILYGMLLFRRDHELEPLHEDVQARVASAVAGLGPYDAAGFAQDVEQLVEWRALERLSWTPLPTPLRSLRLR